MGKGCDVGGGHGGPFGVPIILAVGIGRRGKHGGPGENLAALHLSSIRLVIPIPLGSV